MSLSANGGPLSRSPAGRLNFPLELPGAAIYVDPMPHWIRATFAGEAVVDSRRPFLLHESGRLPVYYFPREDVRADLLEPSQKHSECPYKGTASYWSLCVGDRVATDALWAYPDPIESVPWLAELVAPVWDAFDEWFCEDEQIFGHPRDPFSRIDVYPTSRHVRVLLEGEVLADTRRARVLYETGLPPRYYVPPADVRTDLLEPSSSRSRCAYKGSAAYWSARIGDRLVEDLVWAYPDPDHDAAPVRDLLCFFNERVDLEVDDELAERPRTQWSRDDESPGGIGQHLRGLVGTTSDS